MILAMDTSMLKKLDKGEDLIKLANISKDMAQESQEIVYWVADGIYSWDAIEASEKLRLGKEMTRAHKGGAKLLRDKLLKFMRIKHIEAMN